MQMMHLLIFILEGVDLTSNTLIRLYRAF